MEGVASTRRASAPGVGWVVVRSYNARSRCAGPGIQPGPDAREGQVYPGISVLVGVLSYSDIGRLAHKQWSSSRKQMTA